LNLEEIKKELENKKNLKVAFHSDADGIGSLSLAKCVLDIKEINSPDIFGDYEEEDLSLDLGPPISKNFKGIVIDHHVHENPYYPLIHDVVPTGLIVYNLWKDKIPKEESWKVVISLVGDGQPELIPNEIFELHPYLLQKRGNIYKTYSKINIYDYPIYLMLSSPINSMCRTGNIIPAVKLVTRAKDPLDILESEIAKNDILLVSKEEDRIFQDYKEINVLNDYCLFYSFRSKFKMCGRIAGKLQNQDRNRTYIVLNEENGAISIRGYLASFIGSKLKESGFTCGGHAGFWGGHLLENQTSRDLLNTLRCIL